jgi:hypothetical protein
VTHRTNDALKLVVLLVLVPFLFLMFAPLFGENLQRFHFLSGDIRGIQVELFNREFQIHNPVQHDCRFSNKRKIDEVPVSSNLDAEQKRRRPILALVALDVS